MIRVDVTSNRPAGVVRRGDPIRSAKVVGELFELRLKLAKRFDQNVEGLREHGVKRRSSFGRAHVDDRRRLKSKRRNMAQMSQHVEPRGGLRNSAQLEAKFAQS